MSAAEYRGRQASRLPTRIGRTAFFAPPPHGRENSFAYLDEEEIDVRLVSPLRDHPILLIPADRRVELVKERMADLDPQNQFSALVKLAGHLGSFIGQMTDEPIRAINILYDGRVADMNLAALNQSVIAGVIGLFVLQAGHLAQWPQTAPRSG